MKTLAFKRLLCATALALPGSAYAQSTSGPVFGTETPAADTVPAPEASQAQAGQSPPAVVDTTVADIIVTAQRRSENLQKVPVSVAAVSSAQLAAAGITDLQALRVVVPGLTFSSIQQNVQPRLRGIGSSTAGPGIEPGVAVYVDGVYYASATGALFSFNNVEQISVLKGPQGTLFGRNAVAGLVQVTTRDPSQTFVMEANAGYGNYQTFTGSAYVAGGITENLTADIAGLVKTQGKGYGRNLTLDRDTKKTDHDVSLRSKLIFTPGPDTKIALSADYSNVKGTQGTNRLERGSVPAAGTGPNFGGSVWDVQADFEGFNDNESGGASLKVEQKIGTLNLLSVTAYRKLQYDNGLDLDFTATPFQTIRQTQRDRQFSQELQLQSGAGGPFKWTFGLFYFDANAVSDPLRVSLLGAAVDPNFPLNQIVTIGGQKTRSVAAYGQASYSFASRTTVTVGGRYTDEKRTANTAQTLNLAFGIPSIVLPPSRSVAKFRKPTFRLSVDQEIGETALGYVSFNRGFKSGGFNAQQLNAPAFKPEVLDAYEAGLKTSLFDRRMTLNGAAFYYDYRNIQIQNINPDGSLGILNGAKARAYGIDIDASARVTSAFQLTLGAELLRTKFLDFPGAQISTPAGGVPTTVGSATGNDLPLASRFSGTLGANYTAELADGAKVSANGTVSYNSGWYTEPDNARRQPRFVQINAKLKWTSASERYSAAIWGENLTNAEVRTNAGTTANGSHYVSFAPPRTYGFTLGSDIDVETMTVSPGVTPGDLYDDPYPHYARLRQADPVHFYEPTGEWLVTRWAECQIVGANDAVFGPSDGFMPMVRTMGVPNVLTMTGNDHACLRHGIDAPLQPAAVDGYVDALARRHVRARLATLRDRGEADLTTELFEPISVRCVADVMGLGDIDDPTLARWFHALNAGAHNVADDPAVWTMLDGVKAEIDAALGLVYARVAARPDDSLISHVVHGGLPAHCRRSLAEIMPTLRVILLGGLQEPGHGAANAAFGLLGDAAQVAAIVADPAGLSLKAYDEGLRWIAPIGVSARRATRAVDLGGVIIPAGAIVGAVLASANRDETRWDDAAAFRIDRQRKPHAAFGYRPHFCSGHYLSRNIGRIALEECFGTLRNLRLDPERAPVTKGWRFRGVVSLPARWDA